MTATAMNPTTETKAEAPEARRDLENEAELAKRRLLRTLDKLDHRRHHVVEAVGHVRHEILIAGVVGGVLVGLIMGELRLRTWREQRAITPYRARWSAVRRAWEHPDRVASEGPSGAKGIFGQLATKALGAAASMLLTRLAKGALAPHAPDEAVVR